VTKRLSEILNEMEAGVGRTVKACGLLSLWKRVVDERVGKQTEAVKIRNRTLYVVARSAAWAHELSFLKSEIIEKFNEQAGEEAIRDIKFRSGG
jgi:predicted nucleic acid-binding Zn ribbon protein